MKKANRRSFISNLGLTALGASIVPSTMFAKEKAHQAFEIGNEGGRDLRLPKGFIWGSASAAYQVEGAAFEDGRGPSVWDTFCNQPNKIFNQESGLVACDHFHRYKEDIQLMKGLHTKAYRFSISWSRIFPDGVGKYNPKGLDFYNRLTDELLANEIIPYITLFHWDLPQMLQDKYQGWQSMETVEAFANYAGFIGEKLGDRVKHFFTINEIRSFVNIGHQKGQHAPGLMLKDKELNQVRHHALLAHGKAVQALRASCKGKIAVGMAENIEIAVPLIETTEHIAAASKAMRDLNANIFTAMMEGKYLESYLQEQGSNAPIFTDADMKTIAEPCDFVGMNVYLTNQFVQAANNDKGYHLIHYAQNHPKMGVNWLKFSPESLYWAPRLVHQLWHPKQILITENGCAATDQLTTDGAIEDTDRILYLRNYLQQLQRATAEGVPVKGYFHWSLMDNFEWADGYKSRFGLIYVDFATQKRTPKLSASLYAEIAKNNCMK